MADVYEEQRRRARQDILAGGGFLMRMPIDLQLALFEDDNVYHVILTDTFPGPAVHVFVGTWRCDYFPCLTYDRALARADQI